MRLMSYHRIAATNRPSYGFELDGTVVDLPASLIAFGLSDAPPPTLLDFIQQDEPGIAAAEEVLSRVGGGTPASLPEGTTSPLSGVRFLPPLPNPSKMIAVGRNYGDHIQELGINPPEFPKLFAKYPCNAIGHHEQIIRPGRTQSLDYEAELAFVIGRPARNVAYAEAMDYVFGYTVANDLSARDIQFKDEQVTLAKNFRTFAPMGPYLVSADDVEDPADLGIRLWVNGQLRQDSNTSNLVFDIPYLISFISSVMDLEIGDVVLTGTPGGVGYGMTPPGFLRPGDQVRIELEQVGVLENPVA